MFFFSLKHGFLAWFRGQGVGITCLPSVTLPRRTKYKYFQVTRKKGRQYMSIMENFHLKFHFALSDYCVILSLFIVLYKIKQHNHVCPVTTLTHVTYILLSHICVIYIRGGSRGGGRIRRAPLRLGKNMIFLS
jgi:hypothetical protein